MGTRSDGTWGMVARGCAVLMVAALVDGCSSLRDGDGIVPKYPAALQAYEGEPLPAGEVAVVETAGGSSARYVYAFIRSVDGRRLPGMFDGRGTVEVRPGEHSFGLGFGPNSLIVGAKDQPNLASVTFQAMAGHTYRIHGRAQLAKGRSEPLRPVVYVVDVASGERIESIVEGPSRIELPA